jgi:guanylate kinase
MKNKHLIVISSPSGGGKSTIAKKIMNKYPFIRFSVSATTRAMRTGEINGKDYYFIDKEEFLRKIENNELVEYEEIFGNYYGTMKSEIQSALDRNEYLLFDVDVKGGISLQKVFPEDTLLIFIAPVSKEILEQRLRSRATETEDQLKIRFSRNDFELSMRDRYEYVVVNDILEQAVEEVDNIITQNCLRGS